MNKTTENFLAAINHYQEPAVDAVVYKLVYNIDNGKPLYVTTDEVDLPWVEISREFADTQPQLDPRVTVRDGTVVVEIKKIKPTEEPGKLLVVGNPLGNIATDEYNMLIINNSGPNRWNFIR